VPADALFFKAFHLFGRSGFVMAFAGSLHRESAICQYSPYMLWRVADSELSVNQLAHLFGSPQPKMIVRWAVFKFAHKLFALLDCQARWSTFLFYGVRSSNAVFLKSLKRAMNCAARHAAGFRNFIKRFALFSVGCDKQSQAWFGFGFCFH
jgi:hypothetical protein